jgi:hypothetical protein
VIETNALPETSAPRSRWLPRLSWVNWRQHRATLIGLGLFAALIAGCMLVAGLKMHNLYDTGVRDGCVNPANWAGPCRPLLSPFDVGWPVSYANLLGLVVPLFPIAAGVFLGAPLLAREYAAGTTRFAWTQSAGRTRLTLTKVVLLGLVVLAAGAVIGWLSQWSTGPIIALAAGQHDRWQPAFFAATPVTVAAAAGLASAFGVLAGAVTRHIVPAMAVTAVAAIAFALLTYSRLHYWLLGLGLHQSADEVLGGGASVGYSGKLIDLRLVSGGRWLDQGWYAGPDGRPLNGAQLARVWNRPRLLTHLHDTFQVTWQPTGRFWLFQFGQGGAEVLLALLLGALAIWLVRRRKA